MASYAVSHRHSPRTNPAGKCARPPSRHHARSNATASNPWRGATSIMKLRASKSSSEHGSISWLFSTYAFATPLFSKAASPASISKSPFK